MADSDFHYQVKKDGEWRDAWLADSHDANNKAFHFIDDNGVVSNTDGFIPRGEDEGNFRDRP
jgi:hypothetical protein